MSVKEIKAEILKRWPRLKVYGTSTDVEVWCQNKRLFAVSLRADGSWMRMNSANRDTFTDLPSLIAALRAEVERWRENLTEVQP